MGNTSNELILAIATKTMTNFFSVSSSNFEDAEALETLRSSFIATLLILSGYMLLRTHPWARESWRLVSKEGRTKRASWRRV